MVSLMEQKQYGTLAWKQETLNKTLDTLDLIILIC